MFQLLHLLPPELAHDTAIQLLRMFPVKNAIAQLNTNELSQDLMGMHFKHPLGLAAGFDKHGDVFHKLGQLGFSFLEIGSVTPKPQYGNPKPRLFRLPEQQAIINRYGFNSKGLDHMLEQLKSSQRTCITGINLGKNKQTLNDIEDFLLGAEVLMDQADYFTVNISSPNTPGLRDLQNPTLLKPIVNEIQQMIKKRKSPIPLFVKLSPDMPTHQETALVEFLVEQQIDGLILSNTTMVDQGGLSGTPLKAQANAMMQRVYQITQGHIALIGCGGISSGKDAYERLQAGANLLQIYTSFIYQGPAVICRILEELKTLLLKNGIKNIKEIIGTAVMMPT